MNTPEPLIPRRGVETQSSLLSSEEAKYAVSKSTKSLQSGPPPTTEAILQERQKVHGDFGMDAHNAQSLKKILRESPNWLSMNYVQREALEMICTKIGRICVGDHNHQDHWSDIAGYATLVSKRL